MLAAESGSVTVTVESITAQKAGVLTALETWVVAPQGRVSMPRKIGISLCRASR
jgi:hypothetical protein